MSNEPMVKVRDLKENDVVDLEPAFRAFPQDDEARELADGVHWSIYEGTTLERDAYPTPGAESTRITLEHANGVFDLPADFELPLLGHESEG